MGKPQLEVRQVRFVQLTPESAAPAFVQGEEMMDLPTKVVCELGAATLSLTEIAALKTGTVVVLDKRAGEPISLKANGRLIGEGEIFLQDNRLACRVTRLAFVPREEVKGTAK